VPPGEDPEYLRRELAQQAIHRAGRRS
jgi:hypothetical protein